MLYYLYTVQNRSVEVNYQNFKQNFTRNINKNIVKIRTVGETKCIMYLCCYFFRTDRETSLTNALT